MCRSQEKSDIIVPTTSSPLSVQINSENLPKGSAIPHLLSNNVAGSAKDIAGSSVSDLQFESLNSLLKDVLSDETWAIEQVQHLVNYYLKPCRKFDSTAAHTIVTSNGSKAGTITSNATCQTIQSLVLISYIGSNSSVLSYFNLLLCHSAVLQPFHIDLRLFNRSGCKTFYRCPSYLALKTNVGFRLI